MLVSIKDLPLSSLLQRILWWRCFDMALCERPTDGKNSHEN